MFNLCKTVKIYHTVNHYHQHKTPAEHHQLQFQEQPNPELLALPPHSPIRMVESHLSPRKARTGISLSLKESTASPSKHSQCTHDQDLSRSQHPRSSTNCHHNSSNHTNPIRPSHPVPFDRCVPLIVESKITYGEMSPRLSHKETQERTTAPIQEQETPPLDLPLRKRTTGTTEHSLQNNQSKITSPLKKSTSFLRTSSKSRLEEPVKNSCENSLNNSIDFKFSNYKLKREDASESLLRLSCSSYSQIFDKPSRNLGSSDLSESCSLELRREQSCFLKEYVCEVNESIIISQPGVKSNGDLLERDDLSDFTHTQSNYMEREVESPVKKLKKRYGESLLHPYDKETIVSNSFTSRSQDGTPIVDESVIIEHEIESKFRPVKGKEVKGPEFRMFLAVEGIAQLLVTIKEFPISSIHRINQELSVYREVESRHLQVGISKLYQMYTHGNILVLVKEPYEHTLQEHIEGHRMDYDLISWQFITRSIEELLLRTVNSIKRAGLCLSRLICTEDLVYVLGEWKLHSPDMFQAAGSKIVEVEIGQALEYLRSQILGRINLHQLS